MGPELEALRAGIPDAAKDVRLNLQAVLEATTLSPAQTWGTAVACAITARSAELVAAVLAAARAHVDEKVIDDARAAAALMAMNNVYYRFRHMVGKPSYSERSPRLRMNRLGQVATTRVDFELFCLAVSAQNGCEACIRSHERVVLEKGLTEDHVHDAVRIAATLAAVAIALELP
jgi:alkyl hydroperoxide reductase subunit D